MPQLECPRSHAKPARAKRGKKALAPVAEDAENETGAQGQGMASVPSLRLPLSSRDSGAKEASKRKSSSSSEGEEASKRQARAEDEDQLAPLAHPVYHAKGGTKRMAKEEVLAGISMAIALSDSARAESPTNDAAELKPHQLARMKVPDLRKELAERDLPTDGRKDVLVARLAKFLEGESVQEEPEANEPEAEEAADAGEPEANEPEANESAAASRIVEEPAVEEAEAEAGGAKEETEEDSAVEEQLPEDPSKMTVANLRSELTRIGLPTDGRKDVLVARLTQHLENGGDAAIEAADEAVEDPQMTQAHPRQVTEEPVEDEAAPAAEAAAVEAAVEAAAEAQAADADVSADAVEATGAEAATEADATEEAAMEEAAMEEPKRKSPPLPKMGIELLGPPPAVPAPVPVVAEAPSADEVEAEAPQAHVVPSEAEPAAAEQEVTDGAQTAPQPADAAPEESESSEGWGSKLMRGLTNTLSSALGSERSDSKRESLPAEAAASAAAEASPAPDAQEEPVEEAKVAPPSVAKEGDASASMLLAAAAAAASGIPRAVGKSSLKPGAAPGKLVRGAVAKFEQPERSQKLKQQEERQAKANEQRAAADAARKAKLEREHKKAEEVRRRKEEQEVAARRQQAEKEEAAKKREREISAKKEKAAREEEERRRKAKEEREKVEQRRREQLEEEQSAKAKKAVKERADKERADKAEGEEKQKAEERRKALAQAQKEAHEQQAKAKAQQQPAAAAKSAGSSKAAAAAAAAAGAQPPLPDGWKEYTHTDGRSYYHHAATKQTTWERPVLPSGDGARASQQYPICDEPENSDEESDEDGEEEDKTDRSKIPKWASSAQLGAALAAQEEMDPDDIFNQQVHKQPEVCDLRAIFGCPSAQGQRRYHRRTSSGCWDRDKLNDDEERLYKRAKGFKCGTPGYGPGE